MQEFGQIATKVVTSTMTYEQFNGKLKDEDAWRGWGRA